VAVNKINDEVEQLRRLCRIQDVDDILVTVPTLRALLDAAGVEWPEIVDRLAMAEERVEHAERELRLFQGAKEGQVVIAATGEVRDANAIELGKTTEAAVLRELQAVISEHVVGNPIVAPEKLAEWLMIFLATSRTIDAERVEELRRLTIDLAEERRLRKLSEEEILDSRDKILRAAGVSVVELPESVFETEGREIGSPLLSPGHVPQRHTSGWCEECVCYHP
jgi:hypothetical protein